MKNVIRYNQKWTFYGRNYNPYQCYICKMSISNRSIWNVNGHFPCNHWRYVAYKHRIFRSHFNFWIHWPTRQSSNKIIVFRVIFLDNSKNFVMFTKSSNKFGKFLNIRGFSKICTFSSIFYGFLNFLDFSRML